MCLQEGRVAGQERDRDLLAVGEALKALPVLTPMKSQVVGLRFFGGLSVEETAGVFKISPETVMRDWKFAKATWYLCGLCALGGESSPRCPGRDGQLG